MEILITSFIYILCITVTCFLFKGELNSEPSTVKIKQLEKKYKKLGLLFAGLTIFHIVLIIIGFLK